MQTQGILASCLGIACAMVLWLAYKCGYKAAQLDAARATTRQNEKEQKYAQGFNDRVYALSMDDIRRRLHELANHKR